jgi:hypothetical protein
VSLDGTDFAINEPSPFSRKWFSHKFRGAGLRYEVGLNIRTGDIVWAFGGFPCGEYPDLVLARQKYTYSIRLDEMTLADDTYKDGDYFIYPSRYPATVVQQKLIMARHETVNARLKQFGVLNQCFRHCIDKHRICFHAVVNITQLTIEHGNPLFSIKPYEYAFLNNH